MEGEVEFADLCDEILLHIFHKLPHKLVVRCKLVCKKWRSLISDPFFTSKYNPITVQNHPTSFMMIPRRRRRNSSMLITSMYEIDIGSVKYYREGVEHRQVWTDFSEEGGACGVTVLGSWNGLVALYNNSRGFLLLNPWTKEEKRVQVVNDDFGSHFDLHGLCHDSARDEYKAVLSKCSSTCFYVVSFKDGKYKSKTQPGILRDLNRHGYGFMSTVVKGVPHWIHEHNFKRPYPSDASDSIIYFDQIMEEFGTVQLPEDLAGKGALVGLGALDGQLTVAVRGQLVGALEVWALRECGSWTNIFVVQNYLGSTTISLPSWTADDKVLINEHETYLTMYSFRNQSLRKLRWLEIRQLQQWHLRFGCPHKIVTFVPSLVSPNQCGRFMR